MEEIVVILSTASPGGGERDGESGDEAGFSEEDEEPELKKGKLANGCMFLVASRGSYICVTQSWNFFHQLYNYSEKTLYETQQNIYI